MNEHALINILQALDMSIILLMIVGNTVVGVVSVTEHPIGFLTSYALATAGFVLLAFGYLWLSYIAAGAMVGMFIYYKVKSFHNQKENKKT